MHVIDFHTHAFPDAIAGRAMPALEREADIKAALDGTVSSLLRSMDQAGIETSVICSIATKPSQFESILSWSREVGSDRLVAFPSVHPAHPDAAEQVHIVHQEGFQGIKLHPYYQEFDLDEERVFPLYEAVEKCGLITVVHTGFDIAFPRTRKAGPARIARVLERFPDLKFVTTHLGAWEDWDAVEEFLLGRPVYMEISFSIPYLGETRARDFLLRHAPEFVLFGTDSPWRGQKETLDEFLALQLGEERERKILWENACRLLGRPAAG